jgi:hypothetical protein
VYFDDKISLLTHLVEAGPYKGLYTSEGKAEFIEMFTNDVKQFVGETDTVLYYDTFPSGYLFSLNKPAANTLWLFNYNYYPNMDRTLNFDYYKNNPEPTVIFNNRKIFKRTNSHRMLFYNENDPFLELINSGKYKKVHNNQFYSIYKRK